LTGPGNTVVDTEQVAVNGDNSYTTPTGYLPTATGSYVWAASYGGDSNNNGAADNGRNESETVSPASPAILTTASSAVTLGTTAPTLSDSAVLSGGYYETGNLVFKLSGPNGFSYTQTDTLNGNGTYTASDTLPATGTVAGTYTWSVSYAGDGNNKAAVDQGGTAEQTVVGKASPSILTTPSLTTVTLGTSSVTLNDTAVLSGGYDETGTITFTLYLGSTKLDAETAAVSGNGNYSTPTGYTLPTTGTVTGTYQWDASYSGDTNNKSVSENNATAEQVVVSPASPAITTTPNVTTVTLGTSSVALNDTAVLSGGYHETGTITFTLYVGSTLVNTETATVSGNGSYTTPTGYTLPTTGTVTGTYQWDASYSGDTNNSAVSDNNAANEQVTVKPASPTITTTPNLTSVTLCSSSVTLKDTAVLSGGYNETGTITFTLYSPNNTLLDTEAVTVSGNGTYTTPNGYTLPTSGTVTGTYQWDATYTSGNSNNAAASDLNDKTEQVTVGAPNVIVTKTADCAAITPGQTAGFTVTITNTGTATATGVTLSDPLPAGLGDDVVWSINTAKNTGNYVPADFVINGTTAGSQTLTLASSFNGTLAPGQSIAVDITAPTYADDVSSNCTTQCAIPCNFNGTAIPGGDYIWFSCAVNVQGLSSSQSTTISCTGQTISFTCGGQNYSLPVPKGTLTFSPNCTTATTSCGTGNWVTCVPDSGLAGNEFLCGVPFQVPSGGLPGGISNVTWTGNDSSNANCNVNCEWAAAVYSSTFTANCSLLGVKPCDNNQASQYKNSDNCGTPENYKSCITVGGCGCGGSNYTGSYCTPCPVTPPYMSCGTGTLPNTATVSATGDTGQPGEQASATVTLGYSAADVTVTKTADQSTIAAGQTAGYTVTISNVGTATATGVTLSDPLPAGLGKDVKWAIDTSTGNSADFQITGAVGSQVLSLISSVSTLAAGASLSVHITATTYADDVSNVCTSQCSIPTNFNGTSIPGCDYLWFSCAINVQGLPSSQPTTITCTGQTISFTSGGQNYCLPVPNGTITYSPTCATATASCDASGANWITCVPESGLAGNQFLCGLAFQVPQGGLPGGIQNVTWSGNYSSENNCTINTQWAAAAYDCFATNCSLLGVKPCDDNKASQYQNSDHCGTPEAYKSYVIGGGCGGGGSNYTGSYSGTCPTQGSSCGLGTGTLNNVATVTAANEAACLQNAHAAATIKLTSTITISGTKFNDLTGNGFSADDSGQSGVTIDLYMASNGSSGPLTGQTPLESTTTAANGTYAFTGLAAGTTYYVQEVVPAGYVQTGGGPNGSAGDTYYTICTQAGQTYTGNNFDDYLAPTCTPTNVSFTVNNNNCLTKGLTNLSGATQQGDTVTATFTVPAGMSDQLTLVSYIAPSSSWNQSIAYEQQIFDEAGGTFAPGTYSLTVLIPNCYYQVDFVCGPVINVLVPLTYNGCAYGPDNSNVMYHAEDRFISSDNSGTTTFTTKSVVTGDFAAAGYWSTTTGQNMIKSLNGGSGATSLAQWLATTFPNLYGSGAGSHCLVNSNGSYFTNSGVASAYAKFTGGDQQVFSAALSVYATSVNLAGANVHSTDSHFNASLAGSGMDTYCVGTNGAAFRLANNTTLTVMQLLVDLNAGTGAGAAVASGANTVFSGINTIGNVTNASLADVGSAYTPAQVRTAYGINNLALDGTGQTVAIVDAYDDPAIYQSLDTYDNQFGLTSSGPTLYQQYGPASSFLRVLNQNGQPGSLPATDPSGPGGGNWEVEEALDVEWVHAMAPGAQIILVEANSQALSDLMSAVVAAANQPGVSVVSMSWGFAEGQAVFAQDEALYDGDFTTPAGHQGLTFVASTGDYGTADPEYPAFSPNVVAVGGTSLYLNADNSYNNETGWGHFSNSAGTLIGSGGGTSLYEPEPTYQQGVQSTGFRSTPDVSLIADPSTGAWIADAYNLPADNAFEIAGGTSLSAPCWTGLFALVNQGRSAAGQPTLNSTTPTDAQQALYSLPQGDFNSITSGSNGGYTAAAGYNMVTGLGTPVAGRLVPDLVAYQQSGDSNTTTPISVASAASYDSTAAGAVNVLGVANVFNALTITANAPVTAYRPAAAALTLSNVTGLTGQPHTARSALDPLALDMLLGSRGLFWDTGTGGNSLSSGSGGPATSGGPAAAAEARIARLLSESETVRPSSALGSQGGKPSTSLAGHYDEAFLQSDWV
jgi:uncharacterized repeat protein (TIGR01451 family)